MASSNAIILCADKNLFPAAVFVARRLQLLNNRGDTDVIVFTDSEESIRSADGMALPFRIELLAKPKSVPRELMNHVTYARFFALDRMAGDYERVLYLDTDIYPESRDIFALFDLDPGAHRFAAVRDLPLAFENNDAERSSARAADPRKYLNAGVLLVDGRHFAKEKVFDRLLNIVRKARRLEFLDQTALNIYLGGQWQELSPAFNMMPAAWHSFVRRVFKPVITHFAGVAKPWEGARFKMDHISRREMEAYFPSTPWSSFLVRSFAFKEAWAVASRDAPSAVLGAPPSPVPFNFDRNFPSRPEFLQFLGRTDFADIAQGITTREVRYLPAE